MASDPLIIFTPSGRRGTVPEGTTVLDAARSLGVDIDSVCGGRGICGGLGIFLGFLPCSPHCKPEVQEDKELNGDYDFYRPIIRVELI